MIKQLAEDVQARLRSGVAVTSLGQCVEELVFNSIDAKATCVAVRVDLEAFKIQVVDNGSGMGRDDLSKMGKRYFTSKCSSVADLEKLTFYGFRGEALASIANMASVVEVSSKSSKTAKTFVKLFHNGHALEVCEAELSRPSGGTTVTVCNLFHQLPVRRRCMDPVLEFERVRQKVEAISLMHPSVSLSLRNDISCSMVLQLPKTRDVYSRFCQIYGLGRSQKLREIKHKSGGFEISGYISTEGHYNKNMQFLYVNRRLVLKTRLHKLIDFLLRKESVICKAKSVPVSRQGSSSPGRLRCGPELYGIFVLNVTCAYSDYDVSLEPAKTLIEFQNWDVLLACVEEGVKMFLKREHLFVEPCCEDIKEFNEDNNFCLCNAPVMKSTLPEDKSIQENFQKACDEIIDSYEVCKLQSKDVKRKSIVGKKSSNPTESNTQETEISSNQKIAELSGQCGNKKAEIPLSKKDDTTSNFIVCDVLEQEPKDTISSQKRCDTHLKSLENLHSSLTEGARSEIMKKGSCDELRRFAENCAKGVGSQQDKVVQKSNTVCISNDTFTRWPSEREDPTETAGESETVYGSSLIRLPHVREGDREATEVIDNAGRGTVSSVPEKVRSHLGLKTCIMQNEPPCERKQTETNLALNMHCRACSVSAKHASMHKMSLPIQSLNAKYISSNVNKECIPLCSREVGTADGNERSENRSLPSQARDGRDVSIATSKRHYETSNVSDLPLATSSRIPHSKAVKSPRRQIAEPRSQPCKKLSLSTQLGSLEKFRRYYGRVKCTLPTPSPEQSEFCLPVSNVQANCDFSRSQNNSHGRLSICETPTLDSNSNSHVLRSLDEVLLCSGETSLDRRALCRSPLTLSDYSEVSKKTVSSQRSPGSLSFKLRQMKSDHRAVKQLGEQLQTDSSRKDNHSFDLESSSNDFLYNPCQRYKSSVEEMREGCSISKRDACPQSDDLRAESRKCTVSLSPLSSTEGEYTISASSVLPFPAEKDGIDIICEDERMLDESSKQNVKDPEVHCMTFPSNLAFSGDNARIGDPRDDLRNSDWLQDFDALLGKTIYINKTTGLSTYNTPPEEFPAACVKDLTTMAVNVVAENGGEGESLQAMLSEWDNPVFVRCPEIAVDVTSGQAENLAVKIHNILYPYRFTKDMIHSMQVLQQVDNKFIACVINTRNEMDKKEGGNLLVLVDQHAAHERIRLEQLIADSYEKEATACGKKKFLSSSVSPPLEIEVKEEQRRILWCCYKNLKDLGLELSFPETNNSLILVKKVPLCFTEREANELRRKRQPVNKSIVEEFIKEQVELVQTTGGARGTMPLTFLKVLASQACHAALPVCSWKTFHDAPCRY
ncbi:DNA mismatch repair protein Mlh3 isoform X2 [Tympanuchus pallidicinctus]|uniref:DNA mismatch repair protein Mlh3 isoform X2 n=1 Tax=Tympanuchus pallidicinctus TaxID=109042 RepID=UPI0022875E90|nr:DNA mismatch repair protein Mlh3 isoform X2 [Tympanuchus pallidicinctus]